MADVYFNFHFRPFGWGWSERRAFFNTWRGLMRTDPFWAPPHLPTLVRELNPQNNPDFARSNPLLVALTGTSKRAVPEAARPNEPQLMGFEPVVEGPVAAAVVRQDPGRQDGVATLGLLHCVNHQDALQRLILELEQPLLERGCRRLIGPTTPSPLLGAGALANFWNDPPPIHAPYNPPYLPALLEACMEPFEESTCYELPVPPDRGEALEVGRVEVRPMEPALIHPEKLAPFLEQIPRFTGAAPPDLPEIEFLLRWLKPWPIYSWSAESPAGTAGVLLMQPDFNPALKEARGGWSFRERLALGLARRRGVNRAKVLALAVEQGRRGQGIGRALVSHALQTAQRRGWQALTFGPLPTSAPSVGFLEKLGAYPRQRYTLFKLDL